MFLNHSKFGPECHPNHLSIHGVSGNKWKEWRIWKCYIANNANSTRTFQLCNINQQMVEKSTWQLCSNFYLNKQVSLSMAQLADYSWFYLPPGNTSHIPCLSVGIKINTPCGNKGGAEPVSVDWLRPDNSVGGQMTCKQMCLLCTCIQTRVVAQEETPSFIALCRINSPQNLLSKFENSKTLTNRNSFL